MNTDQTRTDPRPVEIWDMRRAELVGRAWTTTEARRTMRGDSGRTLTIYNGVGCVVAAYRDGREL